MEAEIKKEHKALTGIRVSIALLVGLLSTNVWHMCSLESFYLEALLDVIGVVLFPYLTFRRKSYKWLFLVYGTVMLAIFQYIYISALHAKMIPEFLMTSTVESSGKEYQILQIEDHYQVPESTDQDYIEGHKYGWQLTAWKFGISESGETLIIPEESVKDVFEKYLEEEDFQKKRESFLNGKRDGSRAAVKSIKSFLELKKADL